ncbi:MAG: TlpA family protein disulfide reductase [Caldilineales bacterium]|nr:TlpA family protein disulfide reductase [Caldilineales bacterium]
MSRSLVAALLLAALFLGSGWIWINRAPDAAALANRQPIPLAGHPAPDFTLPAPDGGVLTLADLRGQAVVLNFWASWCAPCRAEMPELQAAYVQHRAGGLIVLGVNQGEAADTAAAFAAQFGLSFPILLDQQIQVSQAYQTHSLPTTFFIDRNGIIRDRVIGQMSTALLNERLRTIYP